MSEVEGRFIKRGYWINHAQGPIMGQTITTDTGSGVVIVAFLAILTSLGLGHLFHLLTFLFYLRRRKRSTNNSDGLFHQQQALLRTLPTPSSLFVDAAKLWLSWRRTLSSAFSQSISLFVIPLVFAIGITTAGVFSSSIVSSSNIEVLVHSPFCALIKNQNDTSDSTQYEANIDTLALSYAEECYIENGTIANRCRVFSVPKIDFETTMGECPFAKYICESPTIAFDSGLLDMGHDFGFNLVERERVQYRRKTACTILSLEGRVRLQPATEIPSYFRPRQYYPGEDFLTYHFGNRRGTGDFDNVTFLQSLVESNTSYRFDMKEYRCWSSPGFDKNFTPLPEMIQTNADVLLRLINKNSVYYMNPVEDILFSAHRKMMMFDTGSKDNMTWYFSDAISTPIGCVEQFQFCFRSESSQDICSSLNGLPYHINELNFTGATDLQLALLELLLITGRTYSTMSSRTLRADKLLDASGGEITWLPDNQWITELTGWQSYAWAAHQMVLSTYAIGAKVRDPRADSFTRPPSNAAEKKLCQIQKMRKTGEVVNINVFALILVTVFSLIMFLLDMSLLRFLTFLTKFHTSFSDMINAWNQYDVFHLQRQAYEARGEGEWIHVQKEIPITKEVTPLLHLWDESVVRPGRNSGTAINLCLQEQQIAFHQELNHASIAGSDRKVPSTVCNEDHEAGNSPELVHVLSVGSDDTVAGPDNIIAVSSMVPVA